MSLPPCASPWSEERGALTGCVCRTRHPCAHFGVFAAEPAGALPGPHLLPAEPVVLVPALSPPGAIPVGQAPCLPEESARTQSRTQSRLPSSSEAARPVREQETLSEVPPVRSHGAGARAHALFLALKPPSPESGSPACTRPPEGPSAGSEEAPPWAPDAHAETGAPSFRRSLQGTLPAGGPASHTWLAPRPISVLLLCDLGPFILWAVLCCRLYHVRLVLFKLLGCLNHCFLVCLQRLVTSS